jgi:hypothetical protein
VKQQYIAEFNGKPVREGHRTTSRPCTHAIVATDTRSGKVYALGFHGSEFAAHAASKNWKRGNSWRNVTVVEVKGYPVKVEA